MPGGYMRGVVGCLGGGQGEGMTAGFIIQRASLCRSTRLLSGEPLGVHQPESERLRHRRSSRYHPLLVFPHTGSRRKYQTRLVITQPLQSSHQTQGSSTCSALTRSVTPPCVPSLCSTAPCCVRATFTQTSAKDPLRLTPFQTARGKMASSPCRR